jgi:hypothetical protein
MTRSVVAAVLILALVPLLVAANVSLWVSRAVADGPAFVVTVERALDDPGVAGGIADRATASVLRTIESLDPLVRGVAFAAIGLPPDPDPDTLEALARSRVTAVLDSDLLREARQRAALDLHALLRSGQATRSELLVIDGDAVLLDVRPIVVRVLDSLDPRLAGLGLATLPETATRTVLLEVAGVERARSTVDTIESGLPVLLVLIALVVVLAVVVARDRGGAIGWIGVAAAVAGVVAIALTWVAGDPLLRAIEDELLRSAGRAGYAPLVEPLVQQSVVLVVVGLVLVVNGWVAAAVAWTRERAGR